MTFEWPEYQLGQAGRIVTGKTPKGGVVEFEGEDVPFVTPADFSGKKWISKTARFISEAGAQSVKGSLIPEHSVLVTCIGSDMGKAAIAASRCVTNQQINTLIVDESKFCYEYIYYCLSLRKAEIQSLAGGSAQPILNKSAFSLLTFKAPNLGEQRIISSILRPLDDRITLLRETSSTLEEIATTLFKSWFVDFDPVSAKLEGRKPEGMDEATAALFPDSFEQSELGDIPKGWKISNIGTELTSILGGTPSRARPEFWKEGTVAWINSGKVNEFRITAASELITEEALSKSATKLLPSRTTVLAITGATLGQISIVEIAACANQSVIGILQNEKFSTEFIYLWINFNIKKLISSQTGGAQQHINKGNVEELPLLVPDIQTLNRFKSIAQPLFIKIAENCFQISTLSSIRDSLLPRLISGQLILPDSEVQVETVTA